MKPRHRRFLWIGTGVALLGVAAALVLNAFQSNLVFFFTPTQVAANEAPRDRSFRASVFSSTRRQPHTSNACPSISSFASTLAPVPQAEGVSQVAPTSTPLWIGRGAR